MNKKLLVSTIVLLLVLSLPGLTAAASTGRSPSKNAADLMWGNNTLWQMLAPPGKGTASPGHSNNPAENLYFVAPQTSTPQTPKTNSKLPGVEFDHVISVPRHNQGAFNANWHVYIVLCTSSGITADTCSPDTQTVTNGPTLHLAQSINGQSITSDSVIQYGLSIGAVMLHNTGVVFVCPVAPYSPGW